MMSSTRQIESKDMSVKRKQYYLIRFFVPTVQVKVERARNIRETVERAFRAVFDTIRWNENVLSCKYCEDFCDSLAWERKISYDKINECMKECKERCIEHIKREFGVEDVDPDNEDELNVWNEVLDMVFDCVITDAFKPEICDNLDVEIIAVEEDVHGNKIERKLRRTRKLREIVREVCKRLVSKTAFDHAKE